MESNIFQLSHEQKSFIEASSTNNIHAGGKNISQLLLLKVCRSFLFRQSKKTCGILWSA